MSGEKQALSYDCMIEGCPVRIRPMREEDVPMAARLEASAFSQPWSEASLLAVLKQENALYVVAETQEGIVGLCGVINACGDGDVGNVSVEQSLRGKGLGTEMLRQLMRWGRTIGVEQYTLELDGIAQLDWTAEQMAKQTEIQYLLDEENEETAESETSSEESAELSE